ncbi:hypothetical protein HF086_006734 [Spodoptera exigua]|uniref:Uncharacterized protein n=1 Tax=Spodoptera exigua TaxID=7107 RepID=A0A922M0V8_SPOEX|nr:hypothetical protein HF086_006734 [Spodoptera exigua]
MDSEDDIQPLIEYEGSRDLYLELTAQLINTDPEFEQLIIRPNIPVYKLLFCSVLGFSHFECYSFSLINQDYKTLLSVYLGNIPEEMQELLHTPNITQRYCRY